MINFIDTYPKQQLQEFVNWYRERHVHYEAYTCPRVKVVCGNDKDLIKVWNNYILRYLKEEHDVVTIRCGSCDTPFENLTKRIRHMCGVDVHESYIRKLFLDWVVVEIAKELEK